MHSNTFWLIKLMVYFSLSYLQLENRVLPPIGATSRAVKRNSFNGAREPLATPTAPSAAAAAASAAAADIKPFDNELTPNTAAVQHNNEPCSMGYNARDLRAKSGSCNEFHANTCNGDRSDKSLNNAINLNIAPKTSRTNSCPKLPTLLTDSKAGNTLNCK